MKSGSSGLDKSVMPSSAESLNDIVIRDRSLSEHGLTQRHRGSTEELSRLYTGPSSSASEFSATSARGPRSHARRKQFFDPERRFMGNPKGNSVEYETGSGAEGLPDSAKNVRGAGGNLGNQQQSGGVKKLGGQPSYAQDSPLSFHGQHSEFEREHLEKAAHGQVAGSAWSHPKMSPYLDQDAINAQRQSYEDQQENALEIGKSEHDSASLRAKQRLRTMLPRFHRRKKQQGHEISKSRGGEKVEEEGRSSDADFSEDKTASSEQARRRIPRWQIWKRKHFWTIWLPLFISAGLFTASAVSFIMDHNMRFGHYKAYSYGFFIACLYPMWWVGSILTHCIVVAVESAALTKGKTMYYLYAVRRPLAGFLRAGCLMGVFVGCFRNQSRGDVPDSVRNGYVYAVKFLLCLFLFCLAFVFAKLASRAMSTHFHQKAYFDKMRSALQKEIFLEKLTTPVEDIPTGKDLFLNEHGRPDASAFKRNLFDASNKKLKQWTGTDTIAKKVEEKIEADDPEHMPSEVGDELYSERRKEARRKGQARQGESPSPVHSRQSHEGSRRHNQMQNEEQEGRSCPRRQISESSSSSDSGAEIKENDSDNGKQASRHNYVQNRPAPQIGEDVRSDAASHRSNPSFWRWILKDKADDEIDSQMMIDAMGKRRPKGSQGKKEFNHDNILKLRSAEKHLRRNRLKVSFADQLGKDGSDKQDPKRLAYAVFFNVKPYEADRNYILEEDLEPFFRNKPKEARSAFKVLDHTSQDKATLRHVRLAVDQIHQERKDLAASLKDTKTIVGKLEILILIVLQLILILVYLIIFEVNVSKVWITASTILVAFSFIFAKVISELFESIIFLFSVRPFDTGDGILLGLTDGNLHVVEEVALQSCLFNRWDGARVYFPTANLARTPFINVSRSGLKWEGFIFFIDMNSPPDTIEHLRKAIRAYVRQPDTDLTGRFACCNYGSGNPLKYKVGVYFEHAQTGTDLGRLDETRHRFYMMLCQACVDLGLKYSMPAICKADDLDDETAAQLEDEFKRPFLVKA